MRIEPGVKRGVASARCQACRHAAFSGGSNTRRLMAPELPHAAPKRSPGHIALSTTPLDRYVVGVDGDARESAGESRSSHQPALRRAEQPRPSRGRTARAIAGRMDASASSVARTSVTCSRAARTKSIAKPWSAASCCDAVNRQPPEVVRFHVQRETRKGTVNTTAPPGAVSRRRPSNAASMSATCSSTSVQRIETDSADAATAHSRDRLKIATDWLLFWTTSMPTYVAAIAPRPARGTAARRSPRQAPGRGGRRPSSGRSAVANPGVHGADCPAVASRSPRR